MDGKAKDWQMDCNGFEWLLDLNEAIDVWQDMNDHEVRPPVNDDPNFKGFKTVGIRNL